jgi:hypothetical protein
MDDFEKMIIELLAKYGIDFTPDPEPEIVLYRQACSNPNIIWRPKPWTRPKP